MYCWSTAFRRRAMEGGEGSMSGSPLPERERGVWVRLSTLAIAGRLKAVLQTIPSLTLRVGVLLHTQPHAGELGGEEVAFYGFEEAGVAGFPGFVGGGEVLAGVGFDGCYPFDMGSEAG
jgi:hypothetical protein